MHLVAPKGLNAVRAALYLGGVVFEDTHSDGQGPQLVVNGGVADPAAGHASLLRATRRLLSSHFPTLALRVDEILHALSEVEAKMKFTADNNNEIAQRELETAIIPRYASLIEARLESSLQASSYPDLLLHEIALYCWVKDLRKLGLGGEIDKHKGVREVESKVEAHPRIINPKALQVCTSSPKLKLTYFPFPGRAEPIRLALFIGGIPFEDERIGAGELEQRRSSLPFNQLPVLDVDGEVISQALAILRYAGTLGGLYSPRDFKEALRIDEVFSLVDEFYSSCTWNASYFEKDPEKQMKLRATLAEDTLPKTLDYLEKRVARWNGSFAVGERLTVADLAIYSLLWTFKSGRIAGVPVSVVESFKNLLQVHKTVSTHPQVVKWTAMLH